MTPIELVDALVTFIEKAVKDYNLATKVNGVMKVPAVYAGYLPPEDDEEEPLKPADYPFVIVRFLSDTDDIGEDETTNIGLIIGTYSDDDQNGWRDALNIATRIKIELKKNPLIGPFSLTGKIRTDIFEEQLRPFWHATMDLNFHVPQAKPEWSDLLE
ncbi:hypothetical protein [Bacillus sp. B-jedd]|uniref:hypothetical protein n=1 Tax=Bacillus sp. B-jedd TaxID=1476857 RepID=UPI0005155B3F|nr:hypothetical protein [Bacillus sp. B-jedd]CEG29800.1 hypothetical protein BN1002_04761 [Bacillus sp. B-jedd]